MGLLHVEGESEVRQARGALLAHAALDVRRRRGAAAVEHLDERVHIDPVGAVVDDADLNVTPRVDPFLSSAANEAIASLDP